LDPTGALRRIVAGKPATESTEATEPDPSVRLGDLGGWSEGSGGRPVTWSAGRAAYAFTPAYLRISLYVSSMLWCAVLSRTHLARRASLRKNSSWRLWSGASR
jgi:hypothetical protein